jgi:hypothetical protein
MAFDTKDYNWFGSSGSSSGGGSGLPDYSGAFGSNSPIGADTWKTGFGVDANKGKGFLDRFVSGLGDAGDAFSKYQQQATRGQSSGGSGSSSSPGGEYGGQLTDNLSYLYTPGYAPFTVQGQQGQPGMFPQLLSAGASIAGAFSDIQLKENISRVGKSPSGVNVYQWNYKGDSQRYQGVIAQEVPWASLRASNGYLMVDYSKVDVDFQKA